MICQNKTIALTTIMTDMQRTKSDELWGIDLGGTKIEGVILGKEDQANVLFRNRVGTEAD